MAYINATPSVTALSFVYRYEHIKELTRTIIDSIYTPHNKCLMKTR